MPAVRHALALALCVAATACHRPAAEIQAPVERLDEQRVRVNDATHVRVTTVENRVFPITVELPGRVVIPDKDFLVVSARVQGRIETMNVTAGDRVSAGQVLFKLWSPDLASAAEELAIAGSQGLGSLLELSRQKVRSMGASPEDVVPGASVFPIRAPISGAVIERKAGPGAALNPGDAILTLGRAGALQFVGEVSPESGRALNKGMELRFDDYPEALAVIEVVSPVADPVSRLVHVRAGFKSAVPSALPQETFVKARAVLREVPALIVPARALVFDLDREYVFVRKQPQSPEFLRVPVFVDNRGPELLAVGPSPSIHPGTEVVSDGALLLNDVLNGGE